MAKVIMLMKDELFVGHKEMNEAFRKKVKDFVNYLVEDPTFVECRIPSIERQYDELFESNPDCEVVFTMENVYIAQWQACKRNILTFEWRNFSNESKIVPVNVKQIDDAVYTTEYYSIKVHI